MNEKLKIKWAETKAWYSGLSCAQQDCVKLGGAVITVLIAALVDLPE